MRKFFAHALANILLFVICVVSVSAQDRDKSITLLYFYSLDCHRCIVIKDDVMPGLEKEFIGAVRVDYKDISGIENYEQLLGLKKTYDTDERLILPVIYLEGHFLDARGPSGLTRETISSFIKKSIAMPMRQVRRDEPSDVMRHFESFAPLAIAAAGLADGINPCSFTVIVFFMSFLLVQGYRRRAIAVAGITFIGSVFITYILIGAGLFAALYTIKGFWLISGAVNALVGILSIILGALSAYDAFKFMKTGSAQGVLLRLPDRTKEKIHSIISRAYRVSKEDPITTNTIKLIAGTLAVGFLVSAFESICTGQLYLPTIAFVLKKADHKLLAFGYLLIYNLMFIVPLLAVFALVLAGATFREFSSFLNRNLFVIKLSLAALFIFLGISLIYAH